MRLRRLELARYGKFTDRTIDFGEAVAGVPDLHVVYGPNEAGKSTLFAGFLDLLFGIEMQSRYGFLHPYETMRVGGCLELSDGPHELMRVKKPNPTLRDGNDQPVAQTLLAGALSGLDRAAYRTMFSLDDETLETGGDSILASNGELGQLLFSASAGLSELSQTLLGIRSVADGFTKPNGRSGELQKLKTTLSALKHDRDAIDIQASAYAQLAKTRDDAGANYADAAADLSRQQAELARLRRLRLALPRLAAWQALREKIDRLGDLPATPESWQTELPVLEQQAGQHRSAIERTSATVKRLTDELAALPTDPAASARSGRLAHLDRHGARNTAAELDLAPRRVDLARADEAVRAILTRIGRDDEPAPHTLLLTAAQSATFDALIRDRSGIEQKLAAANQELVDAVQALSDARHRLGSDPIPPAGLAMIGAAVAAWRSSDHALRLRAATQTRDQHDDALTAAVAALHPWSGDAADLVALAVPSTRAVQGWQDEAEQCVTRVARRQERVETLDAELATRQAEFDAMSALPGHLTAADAADTRTAREAAWAEHRRTLDAPSADAFETALRRDDAASGTRLAHERDRAKRQDATQAVRLKIVERTEAQRQLAEAVEGQHTQATHLATTLACIDPSLARLSAADVLVWLSMRQTALAAWEQRRTAERDTAEAHADAERLGLQLQRALDTSLPAETAAILAQDTLAREAKLDLLRNDVRQCERNLHNREPAVARAASADQAWRDAWHAACAGCWLDAAAPFETARAILSASASLGPALDKRADLAGRIRDMELDQAAFTEEVTRLAVELEIDTTNRAASGLAKMIVDRVESAIRIETDRAKLRRALTDGLDAEREAQQAASTHAGRVEEMMRVLQANSLIEVAGKLRDIRDKADLEIQAAAAEHEILATLDVPTIEAAHALLAGHTDAALEGEAATLAMPLPALEQRSLTLFAAHQSAIERIAAVGGDDAAAHIEERRRTQLLEIEDKAQHYLRLRIGIAAADRALRAYRDQHRSSMMQQASDAFSLISRGAYRGLSTQPGRDGDILVALAANGSSKLAQDLSKGARFQLYLALRAAGYREFAKLRPTVPFIADDIMETFDDFRAEETLKVLADMARLGQVIYLTHHGHLRDIAMRVVPGVRLHTLAQ